jgi:hypothetical protein
VVLSCSTREGLEEVLNVVLLNADARVSDLDSQEALKLVAKSDIHCVFSGIVWVWRLDPLPDRAPFHLGRTLVRN